MCVLQRPDNMKKFQFHKEFPQITALQPFLMLVGPPLTCHVTAARQCCTAERQTFLCTALTAVFGNSALGNCVRSQNWQSKWNYETRSCLLFFLLFSHFDPNLFLVQDSLIVSESTCWLTFVPSLNTQAFHSAASPQRRYCFRVEGKNILAKAVFSNLL